MNAPAKPPQFRPPGRMRARIIGLGVTLAPVLVGFALSVFLAGTPPVERLRNITFDQYLRAAPRAWSPDLPVRIVDVDDASLARIGQWPWPRRRIAELTDKLAANGAASIAYDVLFAEPDRYAPGAIISELPDIPEREALRSALEASGSLAADPLAKAFSEAPVVAATALVLRPSEGKDDIANAVKSSFVVLGDDPRPIAPRFAGVVLPLPELRTAVTGLGAINYLSDGDQIIRKAPLLFALGPPGQGILVPSFAVEALRVAFQTDTPIVKSTNASGERAYGGYSAIVAVKIGDAEIPTDADGSVRIRYAGSQPGRLIPAWKVLAGEVDRDEIEGRIVLIGSSAAALSDIRTTPLNPSAPGVEIHAELLEHAITGSRLVRPDWAPGAEGFAVLFGGIIVAWGARRFRPILAALALVSIVTIGAAGSWLLFTRADLLLDPLVPGVAWIATYITGTLAAYLRAENERQHVRGAFQRYVAPAIVERIAADPSRLRLGGETRETTVLFSDVRDFTSRSEIARRRRRRALPQFAAHAAHRRGAGGRRHHRQVHRRRPHGVLERAARRARPCGPRLLGRARHAEGGARTRRSAWRRKPLRAGRSTFPCASASASTRASPSSATWGRNSASNTRWSATL